MHDMASIAGPITAVRLGLVVALGLVTACGGRQVPDHDGYRTAKAQGWEEPTVLELDEDMEAEMDGELSYPKRRRARWFAVSLPRSGELEIRLSYASYGEIVDEMNEDDPFDLAFEVYDDQYRLITRADNEEDDVGERQKRRTLYELTAGTYLIHVFLQRRMDEVDYTLRVLFRSGEVNVASSDFPRRVAFVDPLPAVPEVDDAPRARPRCRGRNCRKNNRRPPRRNTPQQPDRKPESDAVTVPANGLRARIIGVRASGDGTLITINRGSAHGVASGWSGQVTTGAGKRIPQGSFTIKQVKAQESYATVQASPDSVTSAAYAIIKP